MVDTGWRELSLGAGYTFHVRCLGRVTLWVYRGWGIVKWRVISGRALQHGALMTERGAKSAATRAARRLLEGKSDG